MEYTRYIEKVNMLSNYSPDDWDSYSSLTTLLDDFLGTDNFHSFDALKLYKVTALHDHDGARLWRCDIAGNPLNGQLVMFEAGKIKEYLPITRNLWPYWNCRYILQEAFFGGHLLSDTTKPVAIVEDEITALLGSQLEKRFTWLAIGHGQNLTPSLLSQLVGYQVTLFPDDMASEFWGSMAEDFSNVLCSEMFTEININDAFREMALPHGYHT